MVCDNVLCLSDKPMENVKIFFGDYDKLIRIDLFVNEAVRRLKENAEGNTWFVRQINYDRDITYWDSIPDVAKRIFLYNINYQNAMDSGVTNGYLDVMVPIITDPNWQLLYIKIGYEEAIHSESYSYALVTMFGAKATQYLNMVYSDPFIRKRLSQEIDAFSEVKKYMLDRIPILKFWKELSNHIPDNIKQKIERELINQYKDLETKDNKIRIIKMIISNLFLEGIKFPLSFYVTWNINKQYNNPIQGIDTLIREIAHDELNTHVPAGNLLLRLLKKDNYQGFSDLFNEGIVQELALDMVEHVISVEDEWIDFLCKEGEIPGFSKEIGRHFIRYFADRRLNVLGIDPIYKEEESEIIKWFKNYSNVNLDNTALQEADNTAYQNDGLVNDLEVDIISTIKSNLYNLIKGTCNE